MTRKKEKWKKKKTLKLDSRSILLSSKIQYASHQLTFLFICDDGLTLLHILLPMAKHTTFINTVNTIFTFFHFFFYLFWKLVRCTWWHLNFAWLANSKTIYWVRWNPMKKKEKKNKSFYQQTNDHHWTVCRQFCCFHFDFIRKMFAKFFFFHLFFSLINYNKL